MKDFLCADCGTEQDAMNRPCTECGGRRGALRSAVDTILADQEQPMTVQDVDWIKPEERQVEWFRSVMEGAVYHCPVCDVRLEKRGFNLAVCPDHLRSYLICVDCCRLESMANIQYPNGSYCKPCFTVRQLRHELENLRKQSTKSEEAWRDKSLRLEKHAARRTAEKEAEREACATLLEQKALEFRRNTLTPNTAAWCTIQNLKELYREGALDRELATLLEMADAIRNRMG